jgi:hypothetical protein
MARRCSPGCSSSDAARQRRPWRLEVLPQATVDAQVRGRPGPDRRWPLASRPDQARRSELGPSLGLVTRSSGGFVSPATCRNRLALLLARSLSSNCALSGSMLTTRVLAPPRALKGMRKGVAPLRGNAHGDDDARQLFPSPGGQGLRLSATMATPVGAEAPRLRAPTSTLMASPALGGVGPIRRISAEETLKSGAPTDTPVSFAALARASARIWRPSRPALR